MTSEIVTVCELINEPTEVIESVWGEHLVRPGTSLFAGSPKVGKSRCTRCLAYAVASGTALNEERIVPGPVLIYALEGSRRGIRRHFELLFENYGKPANEIILRMPRKRDTELLLRLLREDIQQRRPVLVIIDTLFKFVGLGLGEINDYGINERFTRLANIAREESVHILVVHHASKVQRGKHADPFDAILGATSIRGEFDTNVLLLRRKGTLVLMSEERDAESTFPADAPASVTMLDDGMIRIRCASSTKSNVDDAKLQLVVNYLRQQTETKTRKEMREALNIRNETVRELVEEGVRRGVILKTGKSPERFSAPGDPTRSGSRSYIYGKNGNAGTGTSAPQGGDAKGETGARSTRSRGNGAEQRNGNESAGKSRAKSEIDKWYAFTLAYLRGEEGCDGGSR
jgi:hypothetical protein